MAIQNRTRGRYTVVVNYDYFLNYFFFLYSILGKVFTFLLITRSLVKFTTHINSPKWTMAILNCFN